MSLELFIIVFTGYGIWSCSKLTATTLFQLYEKCGQHERAVSMLEEYVKRNQTEAEISVVYLLVSLHVEGKAYLKALNHIEHAQQVYCAGKELPLSLSIKAGVCHAHLGNLEKAEVCCILYTFYSLL